MSKKLVTEEERPKTPPRSLYLYEEFKKTWRSWSSPSTELSDKNVAKNIISYVKENSAKSITKTFHLQDPWYIKIQKLNDLDNMPLETFEPPLTT